jgi:hypothetical protein
LIKSLLSTKKLKKSKILVNINSLVFFSQNMSKKSKISGNSGKKTNITADDMARVMATAAAAAESVQTLVATISGSGTVAGSGAGVKHGFTCSSCVLKFFSSC